MVITKLVIIITSLIFLEKTILCYNTKNNGELQNQGLESMINKVTKQRQNLTCHVCHSNKHPNCTNVDEDSFGFPQVCQDEKAVCMVRKFAYTLSNATHMHNSSEMKTFAMKRNCTVKCENGCVIIGERTRIYVCSTCCTTTLCNIGLGNGMDSGYYKIPPSTTQAELIIFQLITLFLIDLFL